MVEKFIYGIKKPKIRPITIDRQHCVHTKHDAVLKLPQESASAAGLAPELGNASAQFHHQVRILFHPLCYLVQVLCTICHVQSPKTRAWMALEDVIALSQQLHFFGEATAKEAPVRMHNQLLVSFVVAINPSEESVGIRRMDGDRQSPLPSLFPHTVQPGVIDADQFAASVANAESKILQYLDALGPSCPGLVERLDEIVWFLEMGVVDLGKNEEPAWKSAG